MAVATIGTERFSWLPRPSVLPAIGLLILVGLKLSVLLLFGPTMTPDGSGYIAYADAILSGAFLHVDLAAVAVPITLIRPIGYPAVIAAAKFFAGTDWAWILILFQFSVSICATALVYRLARMFRFGVWISLGLAAAQAVSLQFVLDQAILSDSLCGSTVTIAVCTLSGIALRARPPHWLAFLGAGALLAAAMLTRSVIEYMAIGLIPLAAASAAAERSGLRRLIAFGLVFLPLIATHLVYIEWNHSRVGAFIVTTASQTALFGALIEAAHYDPTIFSGPSPFDDAGRRAVKIMESGQRGYEVESSNILHDVYGWDALRITHEVTLAYLGAWRDHTAAMVHHALRFLSETQLHQAVRPTETVRDVLLWNTGSDHDFARDRVVRHGNWWMIPAVVAHRLAETISVAIFAAFILVTPLLLLRDGLTAEANVSVGLWCFYLVVLGLYAAVNLAPRYLATVVPGSIIVGAANIAWLRARYQGLMAARRAGEASVGSPSPAS